MASTSASDAASTPETPKFSNRLAKERSPYLLQHAHNPVDWFPWGDEAFEKAKKENKLIFLSVGYSTCHWCHVMEHESFEDEEVAKIMNEFYVNIKVDREERPDIDKIYMTFVQATSGRGGWPMSVFLTPELHPVTGGTYFPKEDKWGRPGFKSILSDLASKWAKQSHDFMTSGAHILEVLKKVSEITLDNSEGTLQLPGETCWISCMSRYFKTFEKEFGGFGLAPKFPQPSNLNFLFHAYARDKESAVGKQCLEMCLHTLRKMADGGIHDHISNGFARYSVDDRWHVPHFEKMLYDQAQLAISYTDAYLATKDQFFAEIVKDILTYVGRDLSHKSGGFYSAEDADSFPSFDAQHKKEGAFCVWEYDEVKSLLVGKEVAAKDSTTDTAIPYIYIFSHHFNIEKGGNVDHANDPHGELMYKSVLIILGSSAETAQKFGLTIEKLNEVLDECKKILYEERQKRPRPHLDSKMLCSWNGLMIAAYARAGQALTDKDYVDRAIKAANFVKQNLYNEESGSLYRSCYRGEDGNVAQM